MAIAFVSGPLGSGCCCPQYASLRSVSFALSMRAAVVFRRVL